MKGFKHLALILTLAAGACGGAQKTMSGAPNAVEFEQKIEQNCPEYRVGPLPIATPEEKAGFTDMIGKVLAGQLTKMDFVNQIVAKNPVSQNAVKCAADNLPDPTPVDQPPPK
jgi:hypothetical protein